MSYTCPVEGMAITKTCPVLTCMWNCQVVKTGCMHNSTLLESDAYVAEVKGLPSAEDVEDEVTVATHRIHCLIALDRWCTKLKDRPFAVPQQHIGYVNALLANKPQFSREQGWSISSLYGALLYKEWKKYRGDMQQEVLHREVLGLTRKEYKQIQQVITNI